MSSSSKLLGTRGNPTHGQTRGNPTHGYTRGNPTYGHLFKQCCWVPLKKQIILYNGSRRILQLVHFNTLATVYPVPKLLIDDPIYLINFLFLMEKIWGIFS